MSARGISFERSVTTMWSHTLIRAIYKCLSGEGPHHSLQKLKEFPTVVIEEVTLAYNSKWTRASHMHKPQEWRWLNVKQSANKFIVKLHGKEESLCSRPYSLTP